MPKQPPSTLDILPLSVGTDPGLALQTRKEKHLNGDYPYSDLIENVGVWPDITDDYMTKENLLQNGAPFVSHVLEHTAAQIRMFR